MDAPQKKINIILKTTIDDDGQLESNEQSYHGVLFQKNNMDVLLFEVTLEDGSLRLTVYVDNAVVEVFANDRQAISRRAYTDPVTAGHANLFARGRAVFSSIQTAAMAAANPY